MARELKVLSVLVGTVAVLMGGCARTPSEAPAAKQSADVATSPSLALDAGSLAAAPDLLPTALEIKHKS